MKSIKYHKNKYTSLLHKHPHQECSRCLMNTSDPLIKFNSEGICNHCLQVDNYIKTLGSTQERINQLNKLRDNVQRSGKNKNYDCIIGLSGGIDSSYLAWYVVEKLRLNPLAIHIDTGWNSELAVNNIENIVKILKIDLKTVVIDWEEMKDLQKSFFLSGVANIDVPQDYAFWATLLRECHKQSTKYIISGSNYQTESILPEAWGQDSTDLISIKDIHSKFGRKKLKTYPLLSLLERIYYSIIGIKVLRPLNLIEYEKEKAKIFLKENLNWKDYGGKHYESRFTKFFQAYILPKKYGYDKRLAHLSSLIASDQITKQQAINEINKPLYSEEELQSDQLYWTKKLGISIDLFLSVMNMKPRFYNEYKNHINQKNLVKFILNILKRLYSVYKK